MRSIYGMPSDDLAGGAKRRVPIPIYGEWEDRGQSEKNQDTD